MALETTDQPKNRVWTSIVRWVDNYAAKPEISEGAEQAVDWVRIVPFVFLLSGLGIVRNLNPYPRRIIDRDRIEG